MTKTLQDKADITTSGNVEAKNLGFVSHTNSYRSLKNKPYVPLSPFFQGNVTSAKITIEGAGGSGKISAYTSSYPKSTYRAIGVFGYGINNAPSGGKNSSYCRMLGAYLDGDYIGYTISNAPVKSGCNWYNKAKYKSKVKSIVTITFRVLYVLNDAALLQKAASIIECSQVKEITGGKSCWFYYKTNVPADDLSNLNVQE